MLARLTLIASLLFVMTTHAEASMPSREIAQYEEARLQRMLDRMLGPGRAKALVVIEISRSRIEEVVTRVGPAVEASRSTAERRNGYGSGSQEQVIRKVSRSVKRTMTTGPRVSRRSRMVLVGGRVVYLPDIK